MLFWQVGGNAGAYCAGGLSQEAPKE